MNEKKTKIAIIGGGLAGISAAVELCEHSAPFYMFEQTGRLGGRASSFLDAESGECLDNGQHLISGAYHCFFNLLEKLGTNKHFLRQDSLKVPFLEKKLLNQNESEINKYLLNSSILKGKSGKVLGLLNMKSLSLKSKLNIIQLFIKLQKKSFIVQNISIIDFLKEQKQSEEAIKYFWEPLVLATLNASISLSSALLLARVLRLSFFSDSKSSALLFPKIGLSEYYNNLKDLAIKNNSKLFLNERIVSVKKKENAFELISKNGSRFEADCLIAALPPQALLKILPNEISENPFFDEMKSYKYSAILSVYFWTEKEIFQDMFSALINSKFHWIFNRNAFLDRKSKYFSYTLTTSYAENLINLSKKEISNLVNEELRHFFQMKEEPLFTKIIKERRATLQITPDIEAKRYDNQTPISGFYLAGDWTATALPATIESAAQSGRRAAKLFLKENGNRK